MRAASSIVGADTAVLRGVGFALVSFACFSTSDAIIKLSSGRFSVFQIALTMALFALVPVAGLARGQGGWRALLPRRPRLVLLRGVLTAGCALLAWEAFGRLTLADGYAILFAGPLLVTGLSTLVLGETVGWRRWLAALAGFGGTLVMLRPDFATLGIGHLLAAIAAALGACSFVVLRKIGQAETSASILTVLFATIALVSAPFALADLIAPTPRELMMLALAGLLQGGGQAALVMATRDASAAFVAPFQYTQMIWAVAFGALLFGDRPTPLLLLGMAIVIGAGLYTVWRETARRQPITIGARGEVPAAAAR